MDEASIPGQGTDALWSFARNVDQPDFAPHGSVEECAPATADLATGLDVLGGQVAGDQVHDEWDIEDDKFLGHGCS